MKWIFKNSFAHEMEKVAQRHKIALKDSKSTAIYLTPASIWNVTYNLWFDIKRREEKKSLMNVLCSIRQRFIVNSGHRQRTQHLSHLFPFSRWRQSRWVWCGRLALEPEGTSCDVISHSSCLHEQFCPNIRNLAFWPKSDSIQSKTHRKESCLKVSDGR